jgi:hypothetical protein
MGSGDAPLAIAGSAQSIWIEQVRNDIHIGEG